MMIHHLDHVPHTQIVGGKVSGENGIPVEFKGHFRGFFQELILCTDMGGEASLQPLQSDCGYDPQLSKNRRSGNCSNQPEPN